MSSTAVLRFQWGIIVILLALLIAPYLVQHNASSAGTSGMSPGMMPQLYPLDSAGVSIPTVSFTLTPGAPDGWYLHITTTNFTFTPQNINTAPIADQGHVHLHIDGKLTVVLGEWYHIDGSAMPPGKHTITVALAANDHSEFADRGSPIESTETFYTY